MQAVLDVDGNAALSLEELRSGLMANRDLQSSVHERRDPTNIIGLLDGYFSSYGEQMRTAFLELSGDGSGALDQVREATKQECFVAFCCCRCFIAFVYVKKNFSHSRDDGPRARAAPRSTIRRRNAFVAAAVAFLTLFLASLPNSRKQRFKLVLTCPATIWQHMLHVEPAGLTTFFYSCTAEHAASRPPGQHWRPNA